MSKKQSKSKRDRITIVIDHVSGSIPVDVFLNVVNGHLEALEKIGAETSGKDRLPPRWRIVSVTMNSPFHLIAEPTTLKGNSAIKVYVNGLDRLQSKAVIPKKYPVDAVLSVKRMTESLDAGIRSITVESDKWGKHEITHEIQEHINTLESRHELDPPLAIKIQVCRPHSIHTSLIGSLDDILTHSGDYFKLYGSGGKFTKCFYDRESLLSRINTEITHRVIVTGIAFYNANGFPETMKVEDVKPFRKEAKVRIEDMNINILGDYSSTEFVERIRNGEN